MALIFILNCFQLFFEAQLYGPFQAHAAEFTRRPGGDIDRGVKAASGHRHGTQAIAFAKNNGDNGDGHTGKCNKKAGHSAHRSLGITFGPDHKPRGIGKGKNWQVKGITKLQKTRSFLGTLGIDTVALQSVLDLCGSHRLLSFDRDPVTADPTVEVAHEALIREWDRFQEMGFEVRPTGSVAYKLALVAAGKADATWTLVPKHEWDVAAGAALVAAAGGEVLTLDAEAPRFNKPDTLFRGFLATPPGLREPIMELLGLG